MSYQNSKSKTNSVLAQPVPQSPGNSNIIISSRDDQTQSRTTNTTTNLYNQVFHGISSNPFAYESTMHNHNYHLHQMRTNEQSGARVGVHQCLSSSTNRNHHRPPTFVLSSSFFFLLSSYLLITSFVIAIFTPNISCLTHHHHNHNHNHHHHHHQPNHHHSNHNHSSSLIHEHEHRAPFVNTVSVSESDSEFESESEPVQPSKLYHYYRYPSPVSTWSIHKHSSRSHHYPPPPHHSVLKRIHPKMPDKLSNSSKKKQQHQSNSSKMSSATSSGSTSTPIESAGHNNTVGQSPTSIFSTSSSCDRWFSSDNGTSGTFTSPKYPLPYPANSRCSYHFVGRGKERVQILFQEFDVHKVEDQHRDCEISDSVTAYVTTNGQKEWIDDFCGNELPPRLMSNGHRLTIEFKSLAHNGPNGRRAPYHHQQVPMHKTFPGGLSPVVVTHKGKSSHPGLQPSKTTDNRVDEVEDYDRSDEDDDSGEDGEDGVKKFYFGPTIKPTASSSSSSSSNNHNRNNNTATNGQQSLANQKAKGFRAIYRFVTNFGIEVGKQDSKSVCGFVYNSTVSKNGTFTSPNYPGLYPKDTECHYFFYGNSTERIQIVFTHFDVEGVTPCTLETASDYVEFSNMQSTERKMYRHCGLKHPKSVQSEGDFFRVTFKSNGRFDGTGFMATYGFLNTPGPNTQYKNTRNTVSTSMSTSATLGATTVPTLTLLCIVVLLLLLH